MELLDHTRLKGHRQWRLAQMLLSFIGHGYVWQEGDEGAVKVGVDLLILTPNVMQWRRLHRARGNVLPACTNGWAQGHC